MRLSERLVPNYLLVASYVLMGFSVLFYFDICFGTKKTTHVGVLRGNWLGIPGKEGSHIKVVAPSEPVCSWTLATAFAFAIVS